MMTDERLDELRRWRDVLRAEQFNAEFPKMEAIADAVDEIDRLRAENDERWEEIGEIYDAFEETGDIETRGRTKGVLAERDSMRAEIKQLRAEVAYLKPRAALYVTPVDNIIHIGDDD